MTTTMHDALMGAMHLSSDAAIARHMSEHGYSIASVDTMSRAIHDVYCGIMADHAEPNEKDRRQAQLMLDALTNQAGQSA
ncbi:MAG TPA: hypothetical protein VNL94_07710 [Candidatus Binatia bacterium]|nr:hypothetical protein [Candidatus Binatia bacterium]